MKTKTATSSDSAQAPQELSPELLGLLSSIFSQALRVVKLIREAANQNSE